MKNKQNGITLVALVITIIILLILAGIAITQLTGDNGLFVRAKQAKNNTLDAQNTENAILADYIDKIDEVIGDTKPSITWIWTDTDNDGTKNIGDVVTDSTGEKFYIISIQGDKYALLAEKNIDTNTMKQSDSANTVAFSSTNYWSNIAGITYPYDLNNTETSSESDAIAIARKYGAIKGEKGRLMTAKEVIALGVDTEHLDSSDCPIWINTSDYWLGSAFNASLVWSVYGSNSSLIDDENYGVRPVIEIQKSVIK